MTENAKKLWKINKKQLFWGRVLLQIARLFSN